MEFNILDFVQHILNIVVLYIILRAILYNPVRDFMEKRSAAEAEKLEKANLALESANALRAEYESKLEQADATIQANFREKMLHADEEAAKVVADARSEAARITEVAQARIDETQHQAQAEMTDEAAELAIEIARRVLEREVSAADNQRLVESFFEKVG